MKGNETGQEQCLAKKDSTNTAIVVTDGARAGAEGLGVKSVSALQALDS